jgi:hypothetical protein
LCQVNRRDGTIDSHLMRALQWWCAALKSDIAEEREWSAKPQPPVHVFCDASGSPPLLGVVLCCDAAWFWTHMAPDDAIMSHFVSRRDSQIMGLELLAVSLAMCTFESLLQGRQVVIHCDNRGAEVRFSCIIVRTLPPRFAFCCFQLSVRRGSARAWDHAQLVHDQWLQVVKLRMDIFVKRVHTDDNVADLPSRKVHGVVCVCSSPYCLL